MIGVKVKTDVSGMADLIGKTRTRVATLKAVRAGAKILLQRVKPLAPRRKGSGALRQSQGVKAAKGKRGNTVSFAVQGAKTKTVKMAKLPGYKTPQKVVPAFYDHLVQGGTKPHRLGKAESVGRAAVGRRRAVVATSQTTGGMHPGSPANPYRRRAYEAAKNEIGAAIKKVMGEELQREIEKKAAKVLAKAKAKGNH